MKGWRERLREELKAQGPEFNVTEFSEELGYSRDYITRMLKPDSNPGINHVEKVCKALGVSFVYIFTGKREPALYDQIASEMLSMTEAELIELKGHLRQKEVKRFSPDGN